MTEAMASLERQLSADRAESDSRVGELAAQTADSAARISELSAERAQAEQRLAEAEARAREAVHRGDRLEAALLAAQSEAERAARALEESPQQQAAADVGLAQRQAELCRLQAQVDGLQEERRILQDQIAEAHRQMRNAEARCSEEHAAMLASQAEVDILRRDARDLLLRLEHAEKGKAAVEGSLKESESKVSACRGLLRSTSDYFIASAHSARLAPLLVEHVLACLKSWFPVMMHAMASNIFIRYTAFTQVLASQKRLAELSAMLYDLRAQVQRLSTIFSCAKCEIISLLLSLASGPTDSCPKLHKNFSKQRGGACLCSMQRRGVKPGQGRGRCSRTESS